MIVHLTGSAQNLEADLPYFRKMIDTIHKNQCVLATDWVEPAYHRLTKKGTGDEDADWASIYQNNVESVARADVIIIDVTNMRFAQGYQAALALQQKKPTLLLSRDEHLKDKMASGIADELLQTSVYSTEEEVETIITKFLQDNTVDTKDMRFNFFIDRPIYNYLRWAALKTGKTKAEILRELVQREIKDREV